MIKLNDDELTMVRTMISQFKYGVPDVSDDWFPERQKPLTYGELAELRQMIKRDGINRAAESGRRMTEGLLETFLPPRSFTRDQLAALRRILDHQKDAAVVVENHAGPYSTRAKTSKLLDDAANLIWILSSDSINRAATLDSTRELRRQLSDRAVHFKDIEDTA